MTDHKHKILMITAGNTDEQRDNNARFAQELNEMLVDSAQVQYITYRELQFDFEANSLQAYVLPDMKSLNEFDYVYIKSYSRHSEQALTTVQYLEQQNIPYSGTELRHGPCGSKLTQFAKLALAGIPIIRTIYLDRSRLLEKYAWLCEELGQILIVKAIDGSKGNHNYLVRNYDELVVALQQSPDTQFVVQPFVENNGDIRLLIVGGELQLMIARSRQDGHLNNTSKGACAYLMATNELADEYKAYATKAAAILQREMAGVDMMFDIATDRPYILEVNGDPQVTTGAFKEKKLQVYSNYFKNMLK